MRVSKRFQISLWCKILESKTLHWQTLHKIDHIVFTTVNRKLIKIIDVFGTKQQTIKYNTPLFYIYEDGSVEKIIIIR